MYHECVFLYFTYTYIILFCFVAYNVFGFGQTSGYSGRYLGPAAGNCFAMKQGLAQKWHCWDVTGCWLRPKSLGNSDVLQKKCVCMLSNIRPLRNQQPNSGQIHTKHGQPLLRVVFTLCKALCWNSDHSVMSGTSIAVLSISWMCLIHFDSTSSAAENVMNVCMYVM